MKSWMSSRPGIPNAAADVATGATGASGLDVYGEQHAEGLFIAQSTLDVHWVNQVD